MVTQNTSDQSNIRVVNTTYGADFSAFDKLPSSVRQALANAPYDISSEDVWKAYKQARNDFFNPMSDYEFARDFERNMRCQVQVSSYTGLERYGEYTFRYPKLARKVNRVPYRPRTVRSIFGAGD